MKTPLRSVSVFDLAASIYILCVAVSIAFSLKPRILAGFRPHDILLSIVGTAMAVFSLRLLGRALNNLLLRNLSTEKVESIAASAGVGELPPDFFRGAHPMAESLKRLGPLRNFVVRALPGTGALPPYHQVMIAIMADTATLSVGLAAVLLASETYTSDIIGRSAIVFDEAWTVLAVTMIVYWIGVGRSFHDPRSFRLWSSEKIVIAVVLTAAFAILSPLAFSHLSYPIEPDYYRTWLSIAVGGSSVIWCLGALIVVARVGSGAMLDKAHLEDLQSYGSHPFDLRNTIEHVASRSGGTVGRWFVLGDWNPKITEQSNISSGQFDMKMQGETAVSFYGKRAEGLELLAAAMSYIFGTIALCVSAFGIEESARSSAFMGLKGSTLFFLIVALLSFSNILRKIGLIVMSELSWSSTVFQVATSGSLNQRHGTSERGSGSAIDAGMRTSFRTVVSCVTVRSSSFALPWNDDAAYVRFVTRTDPQTDFATRVLDAIQASEATSFGRGIRPGRAIELPGGADSQ